MDQNVLFWVSPNSQPWLVKRKAREKRVTRFPGTRQEEDKQNKPERKTAWTQKKWQKVRLKTGKYGDKHYRVNYMGVIKVSSAILLRFYLNVVEFLALIS